MSDMHDLVQIYRAVNVAEAHMLANALAEKGIEARVSEQNEPLAGLLIASSDVLVQRSDEAKAREVVAAHEKVQQERAARPDWTCPECGETVLGASDLCDCGAARPGSE